MKKTLAMFLVVAATTAANAQLFGPESMNGALLGSFIGAVAGGHSDHCGYSYSGNGAAIGAGVGFLAGALAGEAQKRQYYASQPVSYAAAPANPSPYAYYAPNTYTAPGYYYQPPRPNYAVNGTLAGALAGGIIGNSVHHQGWEGAGIGAASGLVLGSVAEIAARKHEQKAAAKVQSAPAQQSQTQRQYSSSQSQITSRPAGNSTYYWTTRPQIADARRVPDAPTF